RFRAIFRSAFFIPVVASLVAMSFVWQDILGKNGLLNWLLESLGVTTVDWLGTPFAARASVFAVMVWQNLGLTMLVYAAALQHLEPSLYEAAEVDGAGGWARFRHITVPMVSPVTFF